jgi:hypothetical protein
MRINCTENNIYISNQGENFEKSEELRTVIKFLNPSPVLNIFEDNNILLTIRIETLKENPDLTNQYLHCSIRVLPNSGVMIDGIISQSPTEFLDWTDKDYEAVRIQPFFLSNKKGLNKALEGKGLFEKGLHFSGTVTPSGVRSICICDSCQLSFTIQHFHAGFAKVQYFYSSDSSETLVVPYESLENLPYQLSSPENEIELRELESKLPKPSNNKGEFKYYNPLRCPFCYQPYIDFEKYKEIRPNEYYGNTYINQEVIAWDT